MNTFLGLLAAVVSLVTLLTLSILELWVIPWPILLILLLLTLWISQRLIDRFNPAPVEGLRAERSPGVPKPVSETGKSEPNPLRYRGQVYEEAPESDRVLEKATEEGAEEVQCYRGIRFQAPHTPNPEEQLPPPPLSYRGVKQSIQK